MPDLDITIQVDVSQVIDRFGRRLPESMREEMEAEFRQLAGHLEELVIENIHQLFLDEGRSSGRLESSLLTTVEKDGSDIFIATVSPDLETAPYASILELGGVIPAHLIVPVNHTHLKVPIASMASFQSGEIEEVTQEFLYLTHVNHPGARIRPYYYMRGALARLQKEIGPSIEQAIGRAITNSGAS